MEKKQILESVNRMRLLMGYNPKMTLTENENTGYKKIIIKETQTTLDEQGKGQFLKTLFGGGDEAARLASITAKDAKYTSALSHLDDAVKLGGNIPLVGGGYATTAEELLKALQSGKVTQKGMSQMAQGMMKSPTLSNEVRTMLADKAAAMSFKNGQFAGKSQKQIKSYLKSKGYPDAMSDEIAARYKAYEVKGIGGKKKPTPDPDPIQKNVPDPDPVKPVPPDWKTKIKNLAKNRVFQVLVGMGGLYLVYKWLTGPDNGLFPPCLTRNLGEEDLKKMQSSGVDPLMIAQTGEETIDQNGGGMFFANGEFVSGNRNVKGNWAFDGQQINVTIGGQTYAVPCGKANIVPDDDDNGGGGGGGGGGTGGGYRECNDFPLTKGCQGSMVSEIQGCLKISQDGKFGPQTENALKSKGYSTSVTKEVYDKIMKDCGKTDTEEKLRDPEKINYDETNI